MFLQITRCRVSDFLIVAIVAETNVGAEGAGLVMLARYAKVNAYKGWPILDTLPEGWKIDKKTGSPVAGCEFITDYYPLSFMMKNSGLWNEFMHDHDPATAWED